MAMMAVAGNVSLIGVCEGERLNCRTLDLGFVLSDGGAAIVTMVARFKLRGGFFQVCSRFGNFSVIRIHRFSGTLRELGLALWFNAVHDLGWLLFLGFSVCRFGGSTEARFEEDEDVRGFTMCEAIDEGGEDEPTFIAILVFVAVEGGVIATMWSIMKFSHLGSEYVLMLQGRHCLRNDRNKLTVVMVTDDGLLRLKRFQKLEHAANGFCRRLAMKGEEWIYCGTLCLFPSVKAMEASELMDNDLEWAYYWNQIKENLKTSGTGRMSLKEVAEEMKEILPLEAPAAFDLVGGGENECEVFVETNDDPTDEWRSQRRLELRGKTSVAAAHMHKKGQCPFRFSDREDEDVKHTCDHSRRPCVSQLESRRDNDPTRNVFEKERFWSRHHSLLWKTMEKTIKKRHGPRKPTIGFRSLLRVGKVLAPYNACPKAVPLIKYAIVRRQYL
ncbi:hypothetical protein V8G54_025989 [Vigna mungo]|uniref:Uncharacterized protein n=1 Tax=Vigna mungo TaxID=3915 RepID=A0AAQ3MZQ3_VIGMU